MSNPNILFPYSHNSSSHTGIVWLYLSTMAGILLLSNFLLCEMSKMYFSLVVFFMFYLFAFCLTQPLVLLLVDKSSTASLLSHKLLWQGDILPINQI